MNDSKFPGGFLLGLLVGGGAVFLLGTKSGRNLLKILSERGMDGLTDVLEEYNLDDLEEEESFDSAQDLGKPQESEEVSEEKVEKPSFAKASEGQGKSESPKKHFFKRVRK